MIHRIGTAPRILAGVGVLAGAMIWVLRAGYSLDGGFESQDQDLSVLFVDLPLILLCGALIPVAAYVAARGHRTLGPVLAVAAIVLAAWGLLSWWTPQQGPVGGWERGR